MADHSDLLLAPELVLLLCGHFPLLLKPSLFPELGPLLLSEVEVLVLEVIVVEKIGGVFIPSFLFGLIILLVMPLLLPECNLGLYSDLLQIPWAITLICLLPPNFEFILQVFG